MDWTLEDNRINVFMFFCTIIIGRGGGHIPFVQAGVELSNTSAEVVKIDPHCSCEVIQGRWADVGDESTGSRKVVQPLHLPLVIPQSAAHTLWLSDELMSCWVANPNGCLYVKRNT